jgi:hypothetical protein
VLAFAGVLAVAAVALMVIGVDQWFFLDEWDFLTDRTAWDLDDLLRPHNEHWSTLPILLYRAVYRAFGLTSYLPYRALAVGSHLLCAVLLRALLRRSGVDPWLATVAVVPWIFFGSGWQDIVWGFQVAWNGALALSMTQLLLADHDGPRDRRDVLAIGAGVGALLCAGIATSLTVAVALALLLRRGWRVAALHAVPLAGAYLAWSAAYGEQTFLDLAVTADKAAFVWSGLVGAVTALTWFDLLAVPLVACSALGVALQVRRGRPWQPRLALPAGLAGGAVAFLVVVSLGRWGFGADFARSSRYLHIVSFLLLPLVVTGLDAVRDRMASRGWAPLAAVAGVATLLWVGLPGNLGQFSELTPGRRLEAGNPLVVETMAAAVLERPGLPDEGMPLPVAAPSLTIGWLRQAVAEGTLEPRRTDDFFTNAVNAQALVILQVDADADVGRCRDLDRPLTLELAEGDRIGFRALRLEVEIDDPVLGAFSTQFDPLYGEVVTASTDVTLVARNPHPAVDAEICLPDDVSVVG